MRPIVAILFILSVGFVFATEPIDTLESRELKEVVVEAENQRTSATVSTYIPGKRQKQASQDAVTLLAHMGIPQIEVNPATLTVTNVAGKEVALFVDFVEATPQELQGMRTEDVKKVEYLVNPSDPRFHGKNYVINFVMQKYEWGGYTKLHGEKYFGLNNVTASVYSKMSYKKIIYDIYVDESNSRNNHLGYNGTEHFLLPDFRGEGKKEITRFTTTDGGKYRNNTNNFGGRVLYNTDRLQFSNNLSYRISDTPHNDLIHSQNYAANFMDETTSWRNSTSIDRLAKYYNDLTYTLSNRVSIGGGILYIYCRNSSNSDYFTDKDVNIVNDAKETSHSFQFGPNLSWTPNRSNTFYFNGGFTKIWDKINYFGNSPSTQKYTITSGFMFTTYRHNFDKCVIGGSFGWLWESNKISGIKMDSNFPRIYLYTSWSPTRNHQIYGSVYYNKNVPASFQKSPNRLQQDELIWYTGNPYLHDFPNFNGDFSYTWLPNNRLQLTIDGSYSTTRDRCVAIYTPDGPEGTLLRQYVNKGNYHTGNMGFNATAKFLGGRLVAKLRPQLWMRKSTGEYKWDRQEISCTVQLTYYFGNFYLWGWYMTPNQYQNSGNGVVTHQPSRYKLELGWGKGEWKVNLSAYNFAQYSWDNGKTTLDSPYYGFERKNYGAAYHARFGASLTYTIGYGKKVNRADEIKVSGGTESAILK